MSTRNEDTSVFAQSTDTISEATHQPARPELSLQEGMVNWSLEEKAKFREFCRSNDLQDLRAAEFRRLVRLAHREGLLSEILYEQPLPAENSPPDPAARHLETAPSIRPTL